MVWAEIGGLDREVSAKSRACEFGTIDLTPLGVSQTNFAIFTGLIAQASRSTTSIIRALLKGGFLVKRAL